MWRRSSRTALRCTWEPRSSLIRVGGHRRATKMTAADAAGETAAAGASKRLFRFGVLSDVQYAPIPDGKSHGGTPRYYRNALKILRCALFTALHRSTFTKATSFKRALGAGAAPHAPRASEPVAPRHPCAVLAAQRRLAPRQQPGPRRCRLALLTPLTPPVPARPTAKPWTTSSRRTLSSCATSATSSTVSIPRGHVAQA